MRMLKDKVVLITGAGRGIGRDFALHCAAAGASVVVNDLGVTADGSASEGSPAEQVVEEIRQLGGQAVANHGSVAKMADAEAMVKQAIDSFGGLDGVINNAGILRDRIFHKMSAEEWDIVVNVHLNGCFYVSRAAADHFREREGGSYVHMSSASGLVGNFGQANYSAAKLGIVALSKSIALDMGRFNVRSNCIAPFAWTRMTNTIPARNEAEIARVRRLQQMTPDKIAPMAVYLLSDAAQEVNAQVFGVRNNEIFLLNQPRPVRSVHRGEGWTPETIAEHAIPALKQSFMDLSRSPDVWSWDPI
jgi:NAD(P)-dependent dehydrogenase (short-subunit alcohol dehydrogenase family)